jgi:hypothetical protein
MAGHDRLGKAHWRKSTRSDSNSGCVSIALVDNVGFIRDTKDVTQSTLALSRRTLKNFLLATRRGAYDLPGQALDRDGVDVTVGSDALAGGDGTGMVVTENSTIAGQRIGESDLRLGFISGSTHIERVVE